MNNPSPLVPQGSNPEQKTSSRARVRLAVFCVLSIHVVALMAMLMIGCRKPQETETMPEPDTNNIPVLEAGTNVDTMMPTNEPYAPPAPETNTWVAPVPQAPAAGQEYTIVKGDVFATIAKKFPGVTVKAIQEANPTVVPTKLKIGQKIQIPAPSLAAPTLTGITPALDTSAVSAQDYTVKSGDTLTGIASRHATTVKALRSENNLTTDKIRVGQKLKIPVKAAAPVPASAPAPVEPAPVTPVPAPAPVQQ